MPCFDNMFAETEERPIEYEGNWIIRKDTFPVNEGERLCIVFESTDSEWTQGIGLWVEGGAIVVNAQRLEEFNLWEDTAPTEVELTIFSTNRILYVKNVWKTPRGIVHSWTNGAAMIVDELPNGRRYRCNDGHPDDDFNDIVFRIERVE